MGGEGEGEGQKFAGKCDKPIVRGSGARLGPQKPTILDNYVRQFEAL